MSLGDVEIPIECDACGESETFVVHPFGGSFNFTSFKRTAEKDGWEWTGNDEHYCPDCVLKRKHSDEEE